MKQQRNTKQRQLVLVAVRVRCDHPSADQIYLDVRALDGKISRGTVYRNLNVLVRQGEVLQVKLPDTDRFEGQLDKHYHLICTECGAVCNVPLPYQGHLDELTAEKQGMPSKDTAQYLKEYAQIANRRRLDHSDN